MDGYRDTVTLPGGEFRYEPLHWRTFWFVRVAVSAGDEPFELADFTYRFTTYPQTLLAEYDSSAPDAAQMMEVSWRTLQLCSHETYEDCPYYEQLNYIYDSRNEALQSLALAGETALPRRTIRLFRDSMRPDGLVHARVPSRRKLRLPHFALFWVLMVEDYWRWTGDAEFVRSEPGRRRRRARMVPRAPARGRLPGPAPLLEPLLRRTDQPDAASTSTPCRPPCACTPGPAIRAMPGAGGRGRTASAGPCVSAPGARTSACS